MNRLLVLLITGFVLASGAFAAENDSGEASETDTPVASSQPQVETEPTDEGENDEEVPDIGIIEETRDENFIPSVRITEDLPVAFPVDI